MPTNQSTIEALARISEALENLGVKSKDLKTLNQHIGQQKQQIAYVQLSNKKWRRVSKAKNVRNQA